MDCVQDGIFQHSFSSQSLFSLSLSLWERLLSHQWTHQLFSSDVAGPQGKSKEVFLFVWKPGTSIAFIQVTILSRCNSSQISHPWHSCCHCSCFYNSKARAAEDRHVYDWIRMCVSMRICVHMFGFGGVWFAFDLFFSFLLIQPCTPKGQNLLCNSVERNDHGKGKKTHENNNKQKHCNAWVINYTLIIMHVYGK